MTSKEIFHKIFNEYPGTTLNSKDIQAIEDGTYERINNDLIINDGLRGIRFYDFFEGA